ncbi:lipocalin family protein [Sphingobacterium bovistauri]|uniref:Lipocalin family protein n=1 Tax=Sphingobacterium bovistauri TaxID=2781959 RepID=A0ABS7Z3X5_9SPHI|nr:lipocalin family protein [Sphingobacterium bovistauri]MCA5004876.1 lipocalin family protein [Sphingobacterium bovistauri]
MDKKKSLFLLTAAAAGTVIYNIWKPVKSDLPVITDFELNKYLGEWFEIARLDFFWEKGLKNVRAVYTLNDDGSIKVDNSGVRIKDNKLKQNIGKAKFQSDPNLGALQVSFFGPFYSGYNIMHIEGDYEYALVFGENLDYLWILSRSKTIPEDVKAKYLDYSAKAGYDINAIIWTLQE